MEELVVEVESKVRMDWLEEVVVQAVEVVRAERTQNLGLLAH
jgi:hypothetical protein